MTGGTAPARPFVPQPTALTKPFREAAHRHQLALQRCGGCGRHVFYPRLNCPHCGARDLNWVTASGRGVVYTYTVARRPTHPAFAGREPYVIAIVDLEEGPRMTTNIVGCDADSVHIGMAVEATFEAVTDEISLVYFKPAGQQVAKSAEERP